MNIIYYWYIITYDVLQIRLCICFTKNMARMDLR